MLFVRQLLSLQNLLTVAGKISVVCGMESKMYTRLDQNGIDSVFCQIDAKFRIFSVSESEYW